jgi:diacylglycerol kinase family enzyme
VSRRRCRETEIRTDGGSGFNVDGELVEADRVRCRVEEGAFDVITG